MWQVISVDQGFAVLLCPRTFSDALYWFVYYQNRYRDIEFDIVPVPQYGG